MIRELLKNELSNFGIRSKAQFNFISKYNKTEEADRIANDIKELQKKDGITGGTIVVTAEEEYNEALFLKFYSLNMTIYNNWNILSFTLDELKAQEIIKNNQDLSLDGYAAVGHYFNEMKNEDLEEVKEYLNDTLHIDIVVSTKVVNLYDSLLYFIKAIQLAVSTSPSLYVTHLYHNTLDSSESPGGIFNVEYDGYVYSDIRFGLV